ncbi:MAG TPA: hypothetical protein EYP56_05010, partial [Planctomycetaceae bacterium]|nr:hypothetical protein [Planctomycetaceae bacterium]
MKNVATISIVLALIVLPAAAAELTLDERPRGDEEWGYRPADGTVCQLTPPGFCWRPQSGIVSWEIECGRGDGFDEIAYRASGMEMNVHCPPRT